MCVCLIRVERRGERSLLLSVLTTRDLSGRDVERAQVAEPDDVLPLVRAFLEQVVDCEAG